MSDIPTVFHGCFGISWLIAINSQDFWKNDKKMFISVQSNVACCDWQSKVAIFTCHFAVIVEITTLGAYTRKKSIILCVKDVQGHTVSRGSHHMLTPGLSEKSFFERFIIYHISDQWKVILMQDKMVSFEIKYHGLIS